MVELSGSNLDLAKVMALADIMDRITGLEEITKAFGEDGLVAAPSTHDITVFRLPAETHRSF